MIEENPIPILIAQYRKLVSQRKAIDEKMSDVKVHLEPLVEAETGRRWTDEAGYAKIVSRSPSVSYDGKAVDDLAQTWSLSEDPVMKSCGQMLLKKRQERPGSEYLLVK